MPAKLTLLYVEDDDITRENFHQILLHYFEKVLTADNGRSGLELYQKHHPDVVLLDIAIPYLSGLQLAAKIREDNDSVPIIMLTAFTDQQKLMQAVNLQLFAYLVKPVRQAELNSTFQKVFKKISAHSELLLHGGFCWNLKDKTLSFEGKGVKITHNERKILELLCSHPERFFTTSYIAESLFDPGRDEYESNSVVQIVSRLKRKLQKYGDTNYFIQNSYGEGYKILLDSE